MSNVWWRKFEIFWTGITEMPTDNTGSDQRCVKVHVIHKDIYIYSSWNTNVLHTSNRKCFLRLSEYTPE